MTGFTCDHGMQAHERELGEAMVEHHILSPGGFTMAIPALVSKLGIVDVLLGVAIAARHRQPGQDRRTMTGLAGCLGMPAPKRKARCRIVIEFGILPLLLVVAGLARRAETPLVNVLDDMAIVAACRQAAVDFAKVAGRAAYILMFAAKRELRLGMIEGDGVPPGCIAVACLAFLAEIAAVRLIGFMTRETGGGGLRPALALDVTAAAGNLVVRSAQREVGNRMVESCGVDFHDVGVAALVVGVTGTADHSGHQPAFAMKAGFRSDIGPHRLVAIKAQSILRRP